MKSIAIIYHSRQGHTQFIAQQIQIGAAKIENIDIDLFTAEQLMSHPELLTQYDGLIWGDTHLPRWCLWNIKTTYGCYKVPYGRNRALKEN